MGADTVSSIEPINTVVGIGASAGGLEALGTFFNALPSDTGCAFVVVQHLSPDHKSLMSELLARHTNMKVCQAEDGMVAEPNCVYLIPPKKNISIFHGQLILNEQDRTRGINLPIDIFFHSLASDHSEHSVAIILSGTGSDGVRGLRAIKEHGGMVMVQEAASARFDGMPEAATATGLADIVDTPEELASQLAKLMKERDAGTATSPLEEEKVSPSTLSRIFLILREETGIDFSNYKPTTVLRRLERRVLVNQLTNLEEYVALLAAQNSEVVSLYRELLIGVTRFWRDEDAFERLRRDLMVPLISRIKEGKEIRIWVAGCSTGEEAYGLAILVHLAQKSFNIKRTIKVFATDIDQEAIAIAQAGIYGESIGADLPQDLLARYFQKVADGYQVVREIRELVIFARHNLIKDPPFTNVHLISCRNVLIYLQAKVQTRVLEHFNFALQESGLLFLGSSETLGELANSFETVDARHKIFRSLGRKTSISLKPTLPGEKARTHPIPNRHTINMDLNTRVLNQFFNTVAHESLPVTILVNDNHEILHILGDSAPYLRFPSGAPVNDITKLARADLHIPLATGIQKALRKNETLKFSSIRLLDHHDIDKISIRIRPITSSTGDESYAAVFISPENDDKNAMSADGDIVTKLSDEQLNQLTDLEQELQYTRESLQATIEELETSNEELQATNEELLSSNEELQSTNEELQSTNEELHTVNSEYQDKLSELAETNADLDNLLTGIAIGIIILDHDLVIRRFSPVIANIFNVMESDIGRPLKHLNHDLIDCDPVVLAQEVSLSGESIEKEVASESHYHFRLRIEPFISGSNNIPTGGVVLTFVDVTLARALGDDLDRAEYANQRMFDQINQGLIQQDASGRILNANLCSLQFFNCDLNTLSSSPLQDPQWNFADKNGNLLQIDQTPFEKARLTEKPIHNVLTSFIPHKQSNRFWAEITCIPFLRSNGELHQVISVIRDVNMQIINKRSFIKDQEKLELIGRLTDTSWWEWDLVNDRVIVGEKHFDWLGLDPNNTEATESFWENHVHPDDLPLIQEYRKTLMETGSVLTKPYRLKHQLGHYLTFTHKAEITHRDEQDTPLQAIGILTNVSEE